MAGLIRLLRFTLGRALIHAGLRVLPPGRVRDEIYNLLAAWGARVRAALEPQTPTDQGEGQ